MYIFHDHYPLGSTSSTGDKLSTFPTIPTHHPTNIQPETMKTSILTTILTAAVYVAGAATLPPPPHYSQSSSSMQSTTPKENDNNSSTQQHVLDERGIVKNHIDGLVTYCCSVWSTWQKRCIEMTQAAVEETSCHGERAMGWDQAPTGDYAAPETCAVWRVFTKKCLVPAKGYPGTYTAWDGTLQEGGAMA
jgi:hypothetical protein